MKYYDQKVKLLILAIFGLVIAIQLLIHHVRVNYGYQTFPSSCVINSFLDCDAVARSNYSEILTIPTASIAIVYFLLFASFIAASGVLEPRVVANVSMLVSSVALLPTVFVAFVSLFILKKVCINCSIVYIINVAIFLLALRSHQKTTPIIGAYKEAILSIWRFICTAVSTTDQRRFMCRLSLLFFFIAIGFSYFAKGYLINFFNEARNKQAKQNIPKVTDFIRIWESQPAQDITIAASTNISSEWDYILGPTTAPVTIVEFSDFECPFCKEIGAALKELVQQSSGEYRLIIKHYPLDISCNKAMQRPLHDFACRLASAVHCAGVQDEKALWSAYDLAIKTKSGYQDLLQTMPDTLSLNKDAFLACLHSISTRQKIESDITLGNRLGVKATPTLFVNSKQLMVPSVDLLKNVLREIARRTSK